MFVLISVTASELWRWWVSGRQRQQQCASCISVMIMSYEKEAGFDIMIGVHDMTMSLVEANNDWNPSVSVLLTFNDE